MRRMLPLLLALFTLTACGSDGPSTPDTTPGTYELETVNGDDLPVLADTDGETYNTYLTSGVVVLSSNKTYAETAIFVTEFFDGSTEETTFGSSGTWTRSGSTVTFTDGEDGSVVTAVRSGTTLTLSADGFVFVYSKQ